MITMNMMNSLLVHQIKKKMMDTHAIREGEANMLTKTNQISTYCMQKKENGLRLRIALLMKSKLTKMKQKEREERKVPCDYDQPC